MTTYRVELTEETPERVSLKISFGMPGSNADIVRDALDALNELALRGGPLVTINGPASLPVAVLLSHGLSHTFGAVGVYDPKLAAYVIAVSHRPDLRVGDLIQ